MIIFFLPCIAVFVIIGLTLLFWGLYELARPDKNTKRRMAWLIPIGVGLIILLAIGLIVSGGAFNPPQRIPAGT